MTSDDILQIMRAILKLATGLADSNVILADQNHRAPLGAYVTIRPHQSVAQHGQAFISTTRGSDTVTTTVRTQMVNTCSLNFYRGEAMQFASTLRECHKRPDVSMLLLKNKIGFACNAPVNNLSALQSDNVEQRAQLDVTLMYESAVNVDINMIQSAQVIALNNTTGEVLQVLDVP